VTEAAQAVLSGAQKAVALAQGPLHALRGTGEEEKQLKNAKTEYASEAEESRPTPRSRRSRECSVTRRRSDWRAQSGPAVNGADLRWTLAATCCAPELVDS
jgi:hypothetical protein